MYCPFCNAEDTKVIDSRLVAQGRQIKRRRSCLVCHERFSTFEVAELIMPAIIKRDGRRENFREDNLRQGLQKAFEKRPVSIEKIEDCITRIKHRLHTCGEREVQSQLLGEWVMEQLRQMDEVAYVRFASVYRRFKDVNDFNAEINRLQQSENIS